MINHIRQYLIKEYVNKAKNLAEHSGPTSNRQFNSQLKKYFGMIPSPNFVFKQGIQKYQKSQEPTQNQKSLPLSLSKKQNYDQCIYKSLHY